MSDDIDDKRIMLTLAQLHRDMLKFQNTLWLSIILNAMLITVLCLYVRLTVM